MKRRIAISLAFLILLSTFSFAYADEGADVIKNAAEFLQKEKVLVGDNNGNLLFVYDTLKVSQILIENSPRGNI